ncbi:hypothetical protein MUU49_15290 [Scandinavium goeteborgense]|nr:hypothetical protein [Scandinavium goeteborgense]MCS2153919.1 hypothetical protein [Scandinavium goeteborgense]
MIAGVGERAAPVDVAQRFDACDVGIEMRIGANKAARVGFNPDGLEIQSLGIRLAACGD